LCLYILSRNREKRFCNKVTQEAILKACARTRNTVTLLVTVPVNRPKTVLLLNFNWTDIWIFCFIH
jgi:hypothetical protein